MNTKKISQYIGILIIVAVTAVSAFTRPSPTPNNNNVYPFIDSVALQEVKKESLSVDQFLVEQAARFDGKVFIDRFISGPTPAASDIYVGSGGTKSKLFAQGNVTAGKNLQADNLKNSSMERVCRDKDGYLVLCGSSPVTPDECPNIEGIQTTVQTDLFTKDVSGNCIKPGTTVITPPPPAPVVPTIEVRYVAVNKNTRTSFSIVTEDYFQKKTTTWFAPIYRINFGTATTAPITFNVGYCTNHGIGSPMPFCRGLPLTMQNNLAAPDTSMPNWGTTYPYGSSLINPYSWSGEKPECSALSQWTGCTATSAALPFASLGPKDTRDIGRHQITIPAGTVDTGWMLHADPRMTDAQKWSPSGGSSGVFGNYYSTWLVYRSAPYKNYVPDMTNVYFFNISDPSGVFDQSKLQNLSKPSYKLMWNKARIY
jgi:hypothetical protein